LLLISAFLLGQAIGDPPWFPHPVVCIGRLITWLEKRLYDPAKTAAALFWRGLLLVTVVLFCTLLVTVLIVAFAVRLNTLAAQVVIVVLLATTLAGRSLSQAAGAVWQPLACGDLPSARSAVSLIVGRDTDKLPESAVARAAVETVAENTVDGVTAPLFYAIIGGAPLALLYKAVNTLDSMLGYKNERYLYFGRVAARLDDFANWLPARLTVPVMLLACVFLRLDARQAWHAVKFDGRKHPSPNSGLTEALVAGALGVTLGGENSYGGRLSQRPLLYADGRSAEAGDIPATVSLMRLTSIFFLIIGLAVKVLAVCLAGKVAPV
jgi:adenosylcobinamide-phosphate synthase